MAAVPKDIKALSAEHLLAIDWGSRKVDLPYVFLRGKCACAHCVNEWTGEQILDISTIPADITIKKMELVGAYAIRINWSDGHDAGLYTWDRLLELSGE